MRNKNVDYSRRIITIPNVLSTIRLSLIPLCIWLYCKKQDYLSTAIIFIISGITDIVDGFIARHFHMISDVGKVLDPVADKMTQVGMLFCLITRFRYMVILLIMLVVKEVFAGVSGLYVIRKTGKVMGADWHGKLTTVMLHTLVLVHLVWIQIPEDVSNGMLILCGIMMIISCVLYARRNIQAVKEG